ncbi:hypothetical protein AB0J72_43980 [Dactylosporangium sp. NPDC049742]|uniref:hypothetical protein n=1 Tax=Dactylosporangium sp. NPDC049742 TaxID=3154737 RepID=UPI00341D34E5
MGNVRSPRRIFIAAVSCVAMVLGTQFVLARPASAASTVTVRVVIEHVLEQGCTDNLSGSDFYSKITIGGQDFNFGPIDGEDEISPDWTAEKAVDVDSAATVPVVITLAESDGFLNFEDDVCDISPNGPELDLTVNLVPCAVTGDVSGVCAGPITSAGNGDADIRFRIEVDLPAATPGLAVRCTHTPLWPQPGDTVTITVESLDGTVQVGDTMADLSSGAPGPALVDHKKIADDLEVWVNEPTGPDLHVTGKTTDSYVITNVPAGDLVYGCTAHAGADRVFTGWRRTRVGAPAEGTAIPVSFTGARTNRVDVVFIADSDSYTAATDPAFLADATDVIKGAYYGQDFFLANQQRFNFWLADQRGDADRVAAPTPANPANTNCVLTRPPNWSKDYSWADTGVILHRDDFRDCANGGVFSTEPTSLGTVLHETGHAPFGLADEYCCDGGYFEALPNPNMFDTLAKCQADAPTLGRPASDCRTVTDVRPTPAKSWFLSEPTPNDLMNADRRPPQAADIRRMNWYFDNCAAGKC